MTKVSLVYISLSGNTESFVRRLTDYLLEQHPSLEVEKIHIKDMVKEGQPFFEMDNPFIAIVHTIATLQIKLAESDKKVVHFKKGLPFLYQVFDMNLLYL